MSQPPEPPRPAPEPPRPAPEPLRPARLGAADLARLATSGLRARPLRAFLSALGLAIGIAAMVSVVGVSTSGQAELDRALARLGTNLLTVTPGQTVSGGPAELPPESPAMVGRIGPVTSVGAVADLATGVYRTDRIPSGQTSGLAVLATTTDLTATLDIRLRSGDWFNAATAEYPAVVLGSVAAQRLDVWTPGVRVWLGGEWFAVVGVLDPVPLAEELNSAALVGWPAAGKYLGFDGHPTRIYLRSPDDQVAAVRAVLGATANPAAPNEVRVSRPSDALVAKQAAESTFTGLLLGLGAVALVVGGVGVANTMVISVLERRAEIGLRRALGATRGQVRHQFLAESVLLSGLGGVAGALLGITVTGLYALTREWPAVVPAWASAGAVGVTVLIGALGGLYPAVRASRLPPTEALATP